VNLPAAVTISTRRLHMRPFVIDDAPKLLTMSHEAGLRRWLPDQVYRDVAHAEAVVQALTAFTAQPPAPAVRPYVLGIEERATRELIGHVGLSPTRGSVEVGYAIEDARQGHGFATEAVEAMARWALEDLGLPEVLGIVVRENSGSVRVLEKAGFVFDREETRTVDERTWINRIYRRIGAGHGDTAS
jgi:RimJ/RimL family protein N-acetyltransferase